MQLSQSQIRLNHAKYQNGNVQMEPAYRHQNIAMVNQIAWTKVMSRANVVVSKVEIVCMDAIMKHRLERFKKENK